MLNDDFGIKICQMEFDKRFIALHKKLFSSTEYDFNSVTRHVYKPVEGLYQVDHSIVHDGENWHVFYITGDMRLSEEWIRLYNIGDYEGCNKVQLEPGNAHAVGATLFELEFKQNIFFPSQGSFDQASRACCSIFKYQDRWGMLYDVRGDRGSLMSLAWSKDLYNWKLDSGNPYLSAPSWASAGSTCKDPHVMLVDGVYLVYYITMDQEGYCCVALLSTTDWRCFSDEGCVFRSAPMLRGTMGIESPCVILRNGLWHLFITYGPGLWHSVSQNPKKFIYKRKGEWNVGTGFYYMGPFHATEIIEYKGDWWMTTDRKEETRRLNRINGILRYRGSYEDEKTLEEGIYLSSIIWDGDQPILNKPNDMLWR